jgi:hypothetical protein
LNSRPQLCGLEGSLIHPLVDLVIPFLFELQLLALLFELFFQNLCLAFQGFKLIGDQFCPFSGSLRLIDQLLMLPVLGSKFCLQPLILDFVILNLLIHDCLFFAQFLYLLFFLVDLVVGYIDSGLSVLNLLPQLVTHFLLVLFLSFDYVKLDHMFSVFFLEKFDFLLQFF